MKKWTVLLLVVLLVVSAAAHAAVPSKTTQDLATVVSFASASGAQLAADFAVALAEPTAAATEQLANVAAVVAGGASPVSYFAGKEEDVAALVPEGFDPNTLEFNEFSPLTAVNYDESYADVVVSFKFATEYADGQVVVAMVGIPTGTNPDGTAIVEWYALKAEVVGGLVAVSFTQEVLALLDGAEGMIAILSESAA
ncbi:MAG: hypothetical protein GX647_12640 [Clostridiales bacterium]|jgi:hypothetical protein|nr:hypothetical protein [Clostridiales bacterium]